MVLYVIATFANASDTDSVGVSSPPLDPDHWIDSTMMVSKSYWRNGDWPASPPALRMITDAFGKFLPVAQAWKRVVDALSDFFMMLKLLIETRPAVRP